MKYNYARRMADMKASEIRELLKLTEKPEVICRRPSCPGTVSHRRNQTGK